MVGGRWLLVGAVMGLWRFGCEDVPSAVQQEGTAAPQGVEMCAEQDALGETQQVIEVSRLHLEGAEEVVIKNMNDHLQVSRAWVRCVLHQERQKSSKHEDPSALSRSTRDVGHNVPDLRVPRSSRRAEMSILDLDKIFGVEGCEEVFARVKILYFPPEVVGSPSEPPPGMVYIPAGRALVGSSEQDLKATSERCGGCYLLDEASQREVQLHGFFVDKYEITYDQYKKCVESNVCKDIGMEISKRAFDSYGGENEGWEGVARGEHAMTHVSSHDAETYCRWAGNKRLLTELEWERVARGSSGRVFPWGDEVPGAGTPIYGNFSDESRGRLARGSYFVEGYEDGSVGVAPVGSFEAGKTDEGVYDMAGNVAEWVSGRYFPARDEEAGRRPPRDHCRGSYAVRGGSYKSRPEAIRGAYRQHVVGMGDVLRGNEDVGIRCAKSAE